MAQIEQSDNGKKKKGAQKKIAIHVDFTPMVDMNMLLITFFMLCTTMIKSQTLKIALPSNDKDIKQEQQNQAKDSEAITLILDTEYTTDEKGRPVPAVDPATGKTIHHIYYYEGLAEGNSLKEEQFIGNKNKMAQGIRAILRERNKEVMEVYDELKAKWKAKEMPDSTFQRLAKENSADAKKNRPVVIIKPGPNTTYEGLINALDEMNINQISRYSIQLPSAADTVLLKQYEAEKGKTIIRDLVRKN